ncbi:MAG: methyltransferase [Planctomycetota bacterium]|nr:MAG: methyltransferase [Planctomycetota bacterium]
MTASITDDVFRGYKVCRQTWKIAGRSFDLTWPADMDALLDLSTTQKRFEQDGYMPYWAQPWPAAVMLAEAVLNGEPGDARSAVDIGCGIGLVGLAAAVMGWSVTAGDYDDDALAFTELNARRNGIILADCRKIDYRQPLDSPAYECVLGADLTYEKRLCEPVARWIASGLKSEGLALISDPNRAVADAFFDCAQAVNLVVQQENVQTTIPDGTVYNGRIWRLTHK